MTQDQTSSQAQDFEKGSYENDTNTSTSSFFNLKMIVGVLVAIVSVLAVVIFTLQIGWIGGSSGKDSSSISGPVVSSTNTEPNVHAKDPSSIQNSSSASQDSGKVPDEPKEPNSNGQISFSSTNGQKQPGSNNHEVVDQEQAEPTGSVLSTQENFPDQDHTESTETSNHHDNESSSEAASEIKDRVFFAVTTNGQLYFDSRANKRIMSIDEDGNDLRYHGELPSGHKLVCQPISNKRAQKVAIYFTLHGSRRCLIQDWNSSDLSNALLTDKITGIPSFSQDGKKLIFKNTKNLDSENESYNLALYDLNSNTVTDYETVEYSDKLYSSPRYSFDGNSIIFLKYDIDGNMLYKLRLDGSSSDPIQINKFSSCSLSIFLLSPTEEKLFKIEMNGLKTDLVLVDTSDNLPEGAQRETVLLSYSHFDVPRQYEIVSWSSDGEFIFMLEHHNRDLTWTLVKMNIRNGEMTRLIDSTNVQ